MSLRLLDLFCCAGGAGAGYARAGYEVTGVDIVDRPRYPHRFVQADALEYVAEHGAEYDVIHASPPCQARCALTVGTNASRGWGGEHVDLLPVLRPLLDRIDRPYVIENPAARADVVLCGEMFGLGVIRHRRFELGGWTTGRPRHRPHRGRVRGIRHGVWHDGPYVAVYGRGGGKASVAEAQRALGIDWTDDRTELVEAIPPAYTEWIGRRFLSRPVQLDLFDVAA